LDSWPSAGSQRLLNQQIQKETGKSLPPAIIDEAFTRIEITDDPIRSSLLTSAHAHSKLGSLAGKCLTSRDSTT
jgi:NitT/TauT family transport system substrate-binding protein